MQLPRLLLALRQGWLPQLLQHLVQQMLLANAFTLPGVHGLTCQKAFVHILPKASVAPKPNVTPLFVPTTIHRSFMLSARCFDMLR